MTIVNRIRRLGGVLAIGGLLLLAADRAAAQTTTGTIRGYVRDSSGAPLAAAEVQAKNAGTGIARSATTNADGSYVLPGLAPAAYDITTRHIGHSPQTRRVTVQIGSTMLADFTLPLLWGLLATIPIAAVSWWLAYRSDWF